MPNSKMSTLALGLALFFVAGLLSVDAHVQSARANVAVPV